MAFKGLTWIYLQPLYFVHSISCWIFTYLLLMIAVNGVIKKYFKISISFGISRINIILV